MKKILCIVLAISLILSINVTAFASNDNGESEFCIDNYTQYTVNLSTGNVSTRSSTGNTIDAAVEYVESLKLGDMGYSYIEEACLNELDSYRDDGVILESYTVLVPKTRTTYYFGTYMGIDYYYDYTSVSDMRRETDGEEKGVSNESQWDSWILGAMDLAMCFSTWEWSVPYTIIRAVTGVSGTSAVHYGSYNQYVEQFTNTLTRTVYKERGSQLDPGYQDQSSSLRVKLYFCPVGTAFASDYYEIDTVFDDAVTANDLTDEQIMSAANVYSNHGGQVIFRVTNHRLIEEWDG